MRGRSLPATLGAAALAAACAGVMAGLAADRRTVAAAETGLEAAASGSAADPWAAPGEVERPALLYERFESIGRAEGLPSDRVTSVLSEGGLLVVGTEAGLAVRRGAAWTVYGEEDGLAHGSVTSITRAEGDGDLWIGTLGGLTRLSGTSLVSYRQTDSGLMNDVVYHVLADGPLVWCATAAGTSCLDTRTGAWALWDVRNSIMHEPWCYALAVGPSRAWIGVWGGGVVELDRRTGRWKEYRDPDGEMEIELLADDGPIHDVTSFVAYDAGVLWQSTYFGISRYDGRRWRSFTAADAGFPGDFVNQVSARGHTVWIATDQGMGVFDGDTCVSYRRTAAGTCDVRVSRGGREVERRELPTAPADDYVLWTQGGETDVWMATGRGLSHGIAAQDAAGRPRKAR